MNGVTFLLSLGNVFFGSLVLMLAWNWIPAEIFAIPTIGYAEAIALSVFTTFFKSVPYYKDVENRTEEERFTQLLYVTFVYVFLLVIAFIVQAFI